MSTKNITILTPNGHRPVVKVTSHSTILEALEEVCRKQNFDPEKYDLKQGNKILDVNTTFGYANVPNNARLEMVTCKNPRIVSNVTINIRLESGEQFVKEFLPSTNLETILTDLGITYEPDNAFLIYLQRKIFAKDFQTTTLRSLGLTQGKHLFRFKTETTNDQAHVYIPAKPKVSDIDESRDNNVKSKPSCSKTEPTNSTLDVHSKPENEEKSGITDDRSSFIKKKSLDPISILRAEKSNAKKAKDIDNEENSVKEPTSEAMKVCDAEVKKETKVEQNGDSTKISKDIKMEEEPSQVYILGERDALVFNRADAKPVIQYETPDSFFEPTKNDAIAIWEDRKRTLENLSNAPLLTAAQKEAIKQKEMEIKLKKFEKTVIRVHFPSQLVLQGVFNPVETVEVIKEFVKTYLEDPSTDFILYTIPPRTDLDPKKRLIDLDLVPNSNVYYSGSSELKAEIKSKLTNPVSADSQATNIRLKTTHAVSQEDNLNLQTVQTISSIENPQPGTSRSNDEPVQQRSPQRPPQPSNAKIPKWFKPFGK